MNRKAYEKEDWFWNKQYYEEKQVLTEGSIHSNYWMFWLLPVCEMFIYLITVMASDDIEVPVQLLQLGLASISQ